MILAVIQARMGSTRLPGKALLGLQGRPVIAHVLERALAIRQVDQVCVAVPRTEADAPLWAWLVGHRHGATARRVDGDPADVLRRYATVADETPEAATIVRLTGDCPLLAPEVADAVISLYRTTPGCAYASNVAPHYVDGTDVEVFSRDLLVAADRCADAPADREHVTPWMRRQAQLATLPPRHALGWLKTSVDTADDLERVRAIAANLPTGDFSLKATAWAARAAGLGVL